ncbi:MAG: LacI family DNA-binding transcriptional regulator [Rariglobus sp.]|nr:LacI family DNA-binding transcriptional regulator [Rariglobus sp.]
MPRRITLRDIALKADVDISTVSRALRNSASVHSETRAQIQKIAAELGYIPDPALSALAAYRKSLQPSSAYQSTLAWLDNWPARGALREIQSFNEYFLGATERANRYGYKLEEFFLRGKDMTPGRMASILRARNIQGIIVPPQQHDGGKLDFDFTHFSAVALGYSLRPALLHVVTNHQFLSISLVVKKLRDLGYRRIALYLYADWDKKVNEGYSSGFLSAQKKLPAKDCIPAYLYEGSESVAEEIIAAQFRDWFSRARPEVIVTQGLYPEIVKWLKPLRVRVPGDVGIVDLSTHPDKPEVSGIYQNDRLIGATAADLVIGMLQRNEQGLPSTLIYTQVDGVWQSGKSVRSASPAPARS